METKRIQNEELAHTVQAFAAYLTSKGRKSSTIKRYVYDIENYVAWLEKNQKVSSNNIWANLRTQDYENYFFDLKENRHYSEKTMHRVLIVLNRLYQFLQMANPGLANPIKDMELVIQPDRALRPEDFITAAEEQRLKSVLISLDGLSEKQLPARPLLIDRNVCILMLLLDYGLSLQELVSLNMQHVHFENNTLTIPPVSGIVRTITLTEEDKKKLYTYYKTIPEPVRPAYHTNDPLFVAFDFNRNTYRWVYENDAPKALTEIAVQKMIRQEVARAGLRKGISGQHFRNTFILRLIQSGVSEPEIMKRVGFKTKLSLKRYYDYAKNNPL
ncbi:tyrosine-type recombinase/integrase [Ectobacillus ponti]|uniref:Tyrosine-type recombinase/integrase n=1 Tax=Ectobacillus ponti TaxID=2961894 RepID=A0AA42BT41_9BACI|nr:tyrosine-type recombinase/integrase [Ectobacillus ponti]MCP8969088.1 tyrosine-type recombinase/integrase [Ectobacillus ponti]